MSARARLGAQEGQASTEEDIKNKYTGAKNAKRFMFLKGGMQFKETQQSMKDLDFLEGLKYSRASIGNGYYVPPEILGSQEASTFSNRREAREYFIANTCVSLMEEFLDFFNQHILRPHFKELANYRLSVDTNKLDETVNKRVKLWEALEKVNTLTINEKREMSGLMKSTEENTDALFISSNLSLLEDAGLTPDDDDMFENNTEPKEDPKDE